MTDTPSKPGEPNESPDHTARAAPGAPTVPTAPIVPTAPTAQAGPAGFLTRARNAFASLFDDGRRDEPIGSGDSAAVGDVH